MPRKPLLNSSDWVVFVLAAAILAMILIATGFEHRAANNGLSVVVVTLIAYRLVQTWTELTVLEHAMSLLLIFGPITASAASLSLLASTSTLPSNPWLWGITLHRLGMVALAVWWRRWHGRRHSAFRHGDT